MLAHILGSILNSEEGKLTRSSTYSYQYDRKVADFEPESNLNPPEVDE
jgi:hypothetical protein